jgi:hypothetical protein
MNKTWKTIAILGVVALLGLIGGVVAFAQSETPAPAPPRLAQVQTQEQVQTQDPAAPEALPPGTGYGQRRSGIGQGLVPVDQEAMHAAIAEVLGLTVAEFDAALAEGKTLVVLAQEQGVDIAAVRAAMATVRDDALEQAVAEGLLTAEEAALLQNRARGFGNQGNLGGGPGMGPGPHLDGEARGLGFVDEAEMHAAIAEVLGITVEQLEARLAEGTPVAVIAQELGIELPVVREAMASVREAAVNQAVSDGLLTAEQAEWLLNRPAFGERAGSGAGYDGTGPGMGRGGQRQGLGGAQHGRIPDELTGVGSGHGQGFGRMNTP